MSVIIYNNVQLPYSNTTQFLQQSVYEESDTDRILTKFDITTQCLINSSYAAQLSPVLAGLTQNPADFMAWVRQKLLAQRQTLSVVVNGVELIPQPQVGQIGTVDAKNGPQPQYCQIIALNDTLFLVNYRIVANYWENSGTTSPTLPLPVTNTNLPGNNVLYNRWKESITVDERNFTHRIRNGRFMIRSDNSSGFIPDQLRTQMAIVGIPANCLRIKNQYTVTEDGLGMDYVQEDQEVFKLPPAPAFTAEGSLTISTSKNTTALITCRVRLKGDATPPIQDNQLTLAYRAISIVQQKLLFFPQWGLIQNAQLSMNMYDNEVEFQQTIWSQKSIQRLVTGAQGISPQPVQTMGGLDFFYNISTLTPFSDSPQAPTPAYKVRGTAGLLLQAAAYYDPSLQNTIVANNANAVANNDLFTQTPSQLGTNPSQLDAGQMPGQTG